MTGLEPAGRQVRPSLIWQSVAAPAGCAYGWSVSPRPSAGLSSYQVYSNPRSRPPLSNQRRQTRRGGPRAFERVTDLGQEALDGATNSKEEVSWMALCKVRYRGQFIG